MQKKLIKLTTLNKNYGQQQVFSNFSYSFSENGLYLLFGESGCGKTTLLNIICGMTSFDSGKVQIAGQHFYKNVEWKKINNIIGYVTQNTVLIDYLTIGEQLELTGATKDEIILKLSDVNMDEYIDRYPFQLSGGEKQRIAIIQAVLQNKKILLLDEPTASLDFENKTVVFQLLKNISKDILILCSSHDEVAKDYANYIIDFNHLELNNDEDITENINKYDYTHNKGKVKLFPYYRKWFYYSKREKTSSISVLIIYIIVFLSLFLGDSPEHKTQVSIEHIYDINHCVATVSDYGHSLFNTLEQNEDILDIVMVYNGSAPDETINGILDDSTSYGVLPSDSKVFRLSNRVAFGNYFSGANQVILSSEKAKEYGDPQSLIGKMLTLNLYGGREQFEIVGIFDSFSEIEKQYLRTSCVDEGNNCIYLSSNYTKQFQEDEKFEWMGQRSYVLYFNSYSAMRDYYSANNNNKNMKLDADHVDYSIVQRFEIMFYFLYPFSFLVITFSLIFYFQTKRIEMHYNKHLISIYDYLGFGKKEIYLCWLKGMLFENLIMLAVAFIVSMIIAFLVNLFNERLELLSFRIFTFNHLLILIFIIFNILCSFLTSLHNFGTIKRTKWHELFSQQQDLW